MINQVLVAAAAFSLSVISSAALANPVSVGSCRDIFGAPVARAISTQVETLAGDIASASATWTKVSSKGGQFQIRDGEGETYVVASAQINGTDSPLKFVSVGVMLPASVADLIGTKASYRAVTHDNTEVTAAGPVVNGFVSLTSDQSTAIVRSVTTEKLGYQIALASGPFAEARVRESRLTIQFDSSGRIKTIVAETTEARGLRDGTALTKPQRGSRFKFKF